MGACPQKFAKLKPFCLDNSVSEHKAHVLCHFDSQVSLLSVGSDIRLLLIVGLMESGHYIRGPTIAQPHKLKLDVSIVAKHKNFGFSDWFGCCYLYLIC